MFTMSVFITHAVAHSSVFDNVVAMENTEGDDLLLEVLHGWLLVGLQLLHSNQLTRVITQRVITAKFNTAKVSLEKFWVPQLLGTRKNVKRKFVLQRNGL